MPNPCQNGAQCSSTGGGYGGSSFVCQCQPGYTGQRCESRGKSCDF